MNPLRAIRSNFKAKVLVPVLGFLVLVPILTLWVVHYRGTVQFERDTRKRLLNAEAIFEKQMAARQRALVLQFRNVAQSAAIKSLAALLESAETPDAVEIAGRTMKAGLADLRQELAAAGSPVEAILYAAADGGPAQFSSQETSPLGSAEFLAATKDSMAGCLDGKVRTATLFLAGELLETVMIPVVLRPELGPLGVLTVAIRIDDDAAKEMGEITGSEIVFTAAKAIVASTINRRDAQQSLGGRVAQWPGGEPTPVLVNGGHHQALAGELGRGSGIHYILLSSYEESLQELLKTQAALWALSLAAILFSAGSVWMVISRATDPIRRLRDKVEAVGRGDFSKRLELNRTDEVGALARSFNEMTANLQGSRAELEKTVETLRTTQNQLVQREKLSAVGEFVAGVAHELNNPLTSLIGFAELLQSGGMDEKQSSYLNYIVKSSQRCHKIVQSLLGFSRQHPPERTLVKVNEILDAVLELLAYEMRTSNIEVLTRHDLSLPPIFGDSHQLQQVVLNLLNNGRQAIQSAQGNGQIRIVTERAGSFVRVTISDNGPGISPENLAKLFDPFFTTKPVGQGTGLGLSLCYGIIKEHGGSIHAASQPGAGATFAIELPIADPPPPSGVEGGASAPESTAAVGAKRVLVIDDEEWILTLARKVLEGDGHQVDVARDGAAALAALAQARYDLLVCDQKMPGLSGPQLYQKLLAEHPDSAERLLFMTGDVVSENFQQFLKKTRKSCLTKPFSLSQLRGAVAEALRQA